MVVVMTGSPNAAAYPGPSATVWANRAKSEQAAARQQKDGFEELREQVLTKKERENQEKREKKREAERKFRAAQKARADKQQTERAERARVRGSSLQEIESEHQKAMREERIREQSRLELAKMRIDSQAQGVLDEDQLEAVIDAGDVLLEKERAREADRQRRMQEDNDARHAAEEKAAREYRAQLKEAEAKAKRDEEEARERALQYEVKKEMARETKKEREKQETKAAEMRRKRTEERKKADKYDAWLGKGDLLRDEQELMNERREGSAMHKGGRFSGVPDTKVDGKGNQ